MTGRHRDAFFKTSQELSFHEALRLITGADLTYGREACDDPWHVPIIRRELGAATVESSFCGLAEEIDRCLTGLEHCDNLEPLAWRVISACSARTFLGPELASDPELLQARHRELILINRIAARMLSCQRLMRHIDIQPRLLALSDRGSQTNRCRHATRPAHTHHRCSSGSIAPASLSSTRARSCHVSLSDSSLHAT